MKATKVILSIFLFVVLCNLPPLHFFMLLISGDAIVSGSMEYTYITSDLKFVHEGSLANLSSNNCYQDYIRLNGNHTLHRLQKIEPWRFWRWGDYLLNEKWRQPYLEISPDELNKAMHQFAVVYGASDGSLRCKLDEKRDGPW